MTLQIMRANGFLAAGMKADSGIDMARKEDYLRAEEFKEVGHINSHLAELY